jgi:phenylalanyl-tRNA synthetase beta subunit
VGLVEAWSRNLERGLGDVTFFEFGVVATHPAHADGVRPVRGGVGGTTELHLPVERELFTVLLGEVDDDARSAVSAWAALSEALGVRRVVVDMTEAPAGWHPTRTARLRDRATGEVVGLVGEVDPELQAQLAPHAPVGRRLGLVQLECDVLFDEKRLLRRSSTVSVPSRYPSATFDLALVTPRTVPARAMRETLELASDLVESVTLFDAYDGAGLPEERDRSPSPCVW